MGGRVPALCDHGNPGMGVAGMAMCSRASSRALAQTRTLRIAAVGWLVHGARRDAAARRGERGMIASDLFPAAAVARQHGALTMAEPMAPSCSTARRRGPPNVSAPVLAPPSSARMRAALVTFTGELGAGKTTLVRASCAGSGHTGPVPSPTYMLLEPYELAGWNIGPTWILSAEIGRRAREPGLARLARRPAAGGWSSGRRNASGGLPLPT